MTVYRFVWFCVLNSFCEGLQTVLSLRNFCRDDFYFQGYTLSLYHFDNRSAVVVPFGIYCVKYFIVEFHTVAVMFALFFSNVWYVPLSSCVV